MAAEQRQPDLADGKICYIIIPSGTPEESASFYQKCFGWNIRRRSGGEISFDDTVGQVSGMWMTGLKPNKDSDLRIYIMVDDIAKTVDTVKANGGSIIKDFDLNEPEVIADFADPFGNVFGLYQERTLAGK